MTEFKHGFAAMARADVADAKRRRADRSLEAYAAARGLEFFGAGVPASAPAGFAPALPRFREEQQQLMRGVLPGGRFGVLLHGLLQTHVAEDESGGVPGEYYGVLVKGPKGSLRKALTPNRTWIPYIGSWLDDGIDDHSTPFGATGAWSPITICATPVPESVAWVRLAARTRSRTRMGSGARPDAGPLRVLRADGGRADAVLDGPFGRLLGELAGPYWEVRVDFGVLTVQRNGFLVEDADLDGLCGRVAALADALAAACAPDAPAPPLSEPLPDAPWAADVTLATQPGMDGGWAADAVRTAGERGLALEDPEAWHLRHGTLPVPGRVAIALRDASGGRVLLCTDRPIPELRAVRPVLVAAAPPGAAPTPPGGVGVPGARVFVQDGALLVWALEHRGYVGEALDLVPALRDAALAYL